MAKLSEDWLSQYLGDEVDNKLYLHLAPDKMAIIVRAIWLGAIELDDPDERVFVSTIATQLNNLIKAGKPK